MGTEASSKVGSYLSSRPIDRGLDGFGMDEAARHLDKPPHGFHYDAGLEMDQDGGAPLRFLPSHRSGASFHPSDAGDRALTIGLHEDNSGRDSSRTHPDILGPVPLFGRHHMERWPPRIPGREHLDIPSRGFGGELDGPRNLRTGEHVRSGELGSGPGSFPNNVPLGESFGNKSSHPRLGEPGFRSSYLIQGFPNDDGIYAAVSGDYNSFDKLRKRKPTSAGWCRICKVDCETVEGLDVHSQTREHQKMAMDMVISIKKKNAKKHKRFNTHSSLDDASKSRSRSAGLKARDTKA